MSSTVLKRSHKTSATNFANWQEIFKRFANGVRAPRGKEFLLYDAIAPKTGEPVNGNESLQRSSLLGIFIFGARERLLHFSLFTFHFLLRFSSPPRDVLGCGRDPSR